MSPHVLAPEWLQRERVLGARPIMKGSSEEIIAQSDLFMASLAASRPPPSLSIVTKDITIKGIQCRVCTPCLQNPKGSIPVGVYTHGVGFICGNLDSEDFLCRDIAEAVPCVIVSVHYRLGPQHKLPVMLQDTLTAYRWLRTPEPLN